MVERRPVEANVAGSSPVSHPSTSSGSYGSRNDMWYVYILLCDQKTYYVGLSHDPTQRFISHINKNNLSTKEFSDLKLIYKEKFNNRSDAVKRETQLKKWSHAKKNALVVGNITELKRLSKTQNLSRSH